LKAKAADRRGEALAGRALGWLRLHGQPGIASIRTKALYRSIDCNYSSESAIGKGSGIGKPACRRETDGALDEPLPRKAVRLPITFAAKPLKGSRRDKGAAMKLAIHSGLLARKQI
jgi:hypothetical protein